MTDTEKLLLLEDRVGMLQTLVRVLVAALTQGNDDAIRHLADGLEDSIDRQLSAFAAQPDQYLFPTTEHQMRMAAEFVRDLAEPDAPRNAP